MSDFDQKKYILRYASEHYKMIHVRVPFGKKQVINDYAIKHNVSISDLVRKALKSVYGINLSKE